MSLTFPVSIGLIGAPDSGKSKIIEHFHKIAEPYFSANDSRLVVVPHPGNQLATLGLAVGPFGSLIEDAQIAYSRLDTELALQAGRASYITSGTIVESLAHCGVATERIIGGIITPETEDRINQQKIAMTFLSMVFAGRFRYTFGFYVPYKPKLIVNDDDEFTNSFNQRIDQAIAMVMNQFGLRVQILDHTSYEEKAEAIFETIKDIMENGPQPGSSADLADLGKAVDEAFAEAAEEIPTDPEATVTE